MSSKKQLIRYKEIRSEVERYVFDKSLSNPVYENELIELILSSEFIIDFYNSGLSLDTKKLRSKIVLVYDDQVQLLKSYNLNYKELSLDYLEESGFQLKELDEVNDDIEKDNSFLLNKLNETNRNYLRTYILNDERLSEFFHQLNRFETKIINERMEKIINAFPNGIQIQEKLLTKQKFTKDEILIIARYVYTGILKTFPPLFFNEDPSKKIKLIINNFRKEIFKLDLNDFFNKGIELLINSRLNSIARYCNYSWNRLIQIAYPSQIQPWQLGKVEQGFWEKTENRQKAVKWLIEQYYNIKPNKIYVIVKQKILSRESFGESGLSYLYNTYYNSLFKAIQESYPHLEIWKMGIYPKGFWKQKTSIENSILAFKWILEEENIDESSLIQSVQQKRLSRDTFSKYNLLTMFDYCYHKNLAKLIEAAFPGKFKAWEIGNTSTEFWQKKENQQDAIKFFIKENKLKNQDIDSFIDNNSFPVKLFKESRLSNFFKKFFNYNPSKIFFDLLKNKRKQRLENERIVEKLKREQNHYRDFTLIEKILYGFNLPLVRQFENRKKERNDRLLKKRKRILMEEN